MDMQIHADIGADSVHSSRVDARIARSISLPDVMYLTQQGSQHQYTQCVCLGLEPGAVIPCCLNLILSLGLVG